MSLPFYDCCARHDYYRARSSLAQGVAIIVRDRCKAHDHRLHETLQPLFVVILQGATTTTVHSHCLPTTSLPMYECACASPDDPVGVQHPVMPATTSRCHYMQRQCIATTTITNSDTTTIVTRNGALHLHPIVLALGTQLLLATKLAITRGRCP